VAEEPSVRQHINDLVAEEHALRQRLAEGEITAEEEHSRLKALETELDQLWDLLRQRQARSEFGQDPSDTSTRSGSTVEGYLQ
jgi:predicted nuclease with TOPRIM domain